MRLVEATNEQSDISFALLVSAELRVLVKRPSVFLFVTGKRSIAENLQVTPTFCVLLFFLIARPVGKFLHLM